MSSAAAGVMPFSPASARVTQTAGWKPSSPPRKSSGTFWRRSLTIATTLRSALRPASASSPTAGWAPGKPPVHWSGQTSDQGGLHRLLPKRPIPDFRFPRPDRRRWQQRGRPVGLPHVAGHSDFGRSVPPHGELTNYQEQMFYIFTDRRYNAMKPTWVSMNVASGEEAEDRIGAAIVDRWKDGALTSHLIGPATARPNNRSRTMRPNASPSRGHHRSYQTSITLTISSPWRTTTT